MASPQAIKLKEAFRFFRNQAVGKPQPSIAEMRAGAVAFGNLTNEPAGVHCVAVDAGGVPAQWLTPSGAAPDRVLLYVHGGGYVMCSAETHRKMVGHIAKGAGCRALNLDYRLAPEHPYPAALNDTVAAYQWLLAQGVKPTAIAIAGDSAGGGLCLGATLKLRDLGLPLPAALMTLSPWTDMEATGASMQTRAADDMIVDPSAIGQLAGVYLQGASTRDPYASPLYAALKGLPPICIQVGDEEVLLDDAVRFAELAKKAGVDLSLEIFPEMQHVFQIAAGGMPEADLAIAKLAAWLKARLGG